MQVRIIGLPPDAEPSPVEHLMSFSHIDGDTMVYRYLGEKDSATRPEQGHAHDPSSFLLTCGACITDARERFHRLEEAHDDFVNEVVEQAHDNYDGDDGIEQIAIRYVRDLEWIRNKAIVTLLQLEATAFPVSDVLREYAKLSRLDIIERGRLSDDILDAIRGMRELITNTDQQDAEHAHGNGSQCVTGCSSYDIAKEWVTALCSITETAGWDARSQSSKQLVVQAAQQLLDKGVIYR